MSTTVNILLAEDDPDDVEFVRRAFAKVWADCRLHVVENGEVALDFLRRTGPFEDAPLPDLVLLDLNMPRKNGYEVLLEVKEDEALRHIPVIVLTTSSDRDSIMKAYQLHANSFITKPVTAEQLERIVELVIEYWFSAVGLAKEG
jgi:two-component system response regulator